MSQLPGFAAILKHKSFSSYLFTFLRVFLSSFPMIVMRITSKQSETEKEKNSVLKKESRTAGKCIMELKLIQQNYILKHSLSRMKTCIWTFQSHMLCHQNPGDLPVPNPYRMLLPKTLLPLLPAVFSNFCEFPFCVGRLIK